MKKVFYIIFLFSVIFSLIIPIGNALEKTTGRVAATLGLRIRNGPGTGYDKVVTIPYNTIITILSYSEAGNGCSDKWAEVVYDSNSTSYRGYGCLTYIEDIKTVEVEETEKDEPKEEEKEEVTPTPPADSGNEDKTETDNEIDKGTGEEKEEPKEEEPEEGSTMANMTQEEFEAYLTSQGFPESYKVKLRELHKLHPTWIFKGVKSNYTWEQALALQNESGRSLYNVNSTAKLNGYEGFLSTTEGNYDYTTDKFYPHDGLYWFQANSDTISYYMDPRNFLSENYVFMFEDLLYDSSYQNANAVNKILSTPFMQQFTQHFITAAQSYNVSPMYLAALSRQEVGLTDANIVINGKAGVLEDGVDYTGYYNFYNIGASSSGNPKLKSLQAAKSYNWNTQQKAIVEGAYKITVNYVQCGQYTSYFQKYNLSPTATKGIWHQYSTNVSAVVGPAKTTFNSYNSMGIIDQAFSFSIPIFDGMPETTALPTLGNPNNWLKELKINNISVTNFSGATTEYKVTVPYSESVEISAATVNENASISGIGKKTLDKDVNEFVITVTAQNKSVKTYKLIITREEKPVVETEPKITLEEVLKSSGLKYDDYYIWNITLSTNVESLINKVTGEYKTIGVNIKNRNNQVKNQGTIVTGDKIVISINGEEKVYEVVIYGDVNGDGNISASDLLNVQKHILGHSTLLGAYNRAGNVNKDTKISASDILNIQKHILRYANISQG